jgi:hypothetical protein
MGQTVAVLKSYLETELELPMADTVSSVDIRAMTDARLRYEPPPIWCTRTHVSNLPRRQRLLTFASWFPFVCPQTLILGEKQMIDPFSLTDYPEIDPAAGAVVRVELECMNHK